MRIQSCLLGKAVGIVAACGAALLLSSCSTSSSRPESVPVRMINVGTYEVTSLPEKAWQVRVDPQSRRISYQVEGQILASASLLASIVVAEEQDDARAPLQDETAYAARIWEREIRSAKKSVAFGLATADHIRKNEVEIAGKRLLSLRFVVADHSIDKDYIHTRYLLAVPGAGGKTGHYLFSYVEVRERFYEGDPDLRHIFAIISSFRTLR